MPCKCQVLVSISLKGPFWAENLWIIFYLYSLIFTNLLNKKQHPLFLTLNREELQRNVITSECSSVTWEDRLPGQQKLMELNSSTQPQTKQVGERSRMWFHFEKMFVKILRDTRSWKKLFWWEVKWFHLSWMTMIIQWLAPPSFWLHVTVCFSFIPQILSIKKIGRRSIHQW